MRARKLMQVAAWILGVVLALMFVGWLGLQVQPAPFPVYAGKSLGPTKTLPLPQGLPKPVERFYKKIYGGRVPVIATAVLTGRATIRPFAGIPLPARYRFTHVAGKDYRHYIEACWFGIPILKINERFIDGTSLMEIPIVGTSKGPKIEEAANQGMWAEIWDFPSVLVTDSRVHWMPVDDDTAILEVPFKAQGYQQFVVRFDPKTGLQTWTETMRWQTTEKVLWMTHSMDYCKLDGVLTNTVGSATWTNVGKPWAVFTLEDLSLNLDVSDYLRAKGI